MVAKVFFCKSKFVIVLFFGILYHILVFNKEEKNEIQDISI